MKRRKFMAEQGLCVAESELRLDDLQNPVMVEVMSKAEIIRRRTEGFLMHKYGDHLLALSFFGDMPCVMVGNPEQEIVIEVEA